MKLKLALFLVLTSFQCSFSTAGTIYSNLAGPQNWVVQTVVWWDDVQIVGGGKLTKVRFYGQQNSTINNVPRTYATSIEFHLFDEATGLPNGPSLGRIQASSATPMRQGEIRLIESADLSSLNIHIPTNARLGVAFHQDHNVAVRLYGPPKVGSSSNTLWKGLPPVAERAPVRWSNIGLELEVVPEPQNFQLLVTAACAIATIYRREWFHHRMA